MLGGVLYCGFFSEAEGTTTGQRDNNHSKTDTHKIIVLKKTKT